MDATVAGSTAPTGPPDQELLQLVDQSTALARSERELKQLNSWGEDHPLQGRHRLLGLALLDEAEDRVGGASWPNR